MLQAVAVTITHSQKCYLEIAATACSTAPISTPHPALCRSVPCRSQPQHAVACCCHVQEKYNIAGDCTPGYDPDEAAHALLLQLSNEETVGAAVVAGVCWGWVCSLLMHHMVHHMVRAAKLVWEVFGWLMLGGQEPAGKCWAQIMYLYSVLSTHIRWASWPSSSTPAEAPCNNNPV